MSASLRKASVPPVMITSATTRPISSRMRRARRPKVKGKAKARPGIAQRWPSLSVASRRKHRRQTSCRTRQRQEPARRRNVGTQGRRANRRPHPNHGWRNPMNRRTLLTALGAGVAVSSLPFAFAGEAAALPAPARPISQACGRLSHRPPRLKKCSGAAVAGADGAGVAVAGVVVPGAAGAAGSTAAASASAAGKARRVPAPAPDRRGGGRRWPRQDTANHIRRERRALTKAQTSAANMLRPSGQWLARRRMLA